MATIQTFKGVVRLTKAQLNTLINTGSLSDGTTTITYDPETTIYLTPQEQASTSDAGVILIATDQDVQTGTNTTKAVTPAQLKTAIIGIGTVFNLKGTKTTASELPASGNTIGDVWYVSSESVGYIWLNDGSTDKWEQLGLPIDLSGYIQYTDVVNNLTSTETNKPLSALQGKNLSDIINSLLNEFSSVEKAEVVYDMSSQDESINWGYSSGIQAGTYISGKDLSKYKRIKVIWKFGGTHGVTSELDLQYYESQILSTYGYTKLLDTFHASTKFAWEYYFNFNIQSNGEIRINVVNQDFETDTSVVVEKIVGIY